jgi:hypothetical protein
LPRFELGDQQRLGPAAPVKSGIGQDRCRRTDFCRRLNTVFSQDIPIGFSDNILYLNTRTVSDFAYRGLHLRTKVSAYFYSMTPIRL